MGLLSNSFRPWAASAPIVKAPMPRNPSIARLRKGFRFVHAGRNKYSLCYENIGLTFRCVKFMVKFPTDAENRYIERYR